MRLLIAHGDPHTRAELRGMLEPLCSVVHDADSPEQLTACLDSWVPDVTLLEDGLGSGGGSLVRLIKSHPMAFSTAILVIERQLALESALRRLEEGAHDFLLEPLRPGEVIARVQAAARTKRLQEELLGQGRRLEALIYEDALTGLYNRRFLLSQMSALVSGSRRHHRPLSAVMIDVDNFKAFNDLYGHDVGDAVLVGVAHAMRDRLRAEDYLGRLGGEEFLALLPDVGDDDAAMVAESLRLTASQVEIEADGEAVRITVSVGWATWKGDEPSELLKRADVALYEAKAAGRNTVKGG